MGSFHAAHLGIGPNKENIELLWGYVAGRAAKASQTLAERDIGIDESAAIMAMARG